jgi:hypothetical protein
MVRVHPRSPYKPRLRLYSRFRSSHYLVLRVPVALHCIGALNAPPGLDSNEY